MELDFRTQTALKILQNNHKIDNCIYKSQFIRVILTLVITHYFWANCRNMNLNCNIINVEI